jgi:hypothetical protein
MNILKRIKREFSIGNFLNLWARFPIRIQAGLVGANFWILSSFISGFDCQAQDTLFFRNGTFSVGNVLELGFTRFTCEEWLEGGGKDTITIKSAQIDSVHFFNGHRYRKGKKEYSGLATEWLAFEAYWEGRCLGEKQSDVSKIRMLTNYLSGLTVIGLPFSLHQALRKPDLNKMSEAEALRYRQSDAFAAGYRKGLKNANLNALLPIYFSGVISSMLGAALFWKKDSPEMN